MQGSHGYDRMPRIFGDKRPTKLTVINEQNGPKQKMQNVTEKFAQGLRKACAVIMTHYEPNFAIE